MSSNEHLNMKSADCCSWVIRASLWPTVFRRQLLAFETQMFIIKTIPNDFIFNLPTSLIFDSCYCRDDPGGKILSLITKNINLPQILGWGLLSLWKTQKSFFEFLKVQNKLGQVKKCQNSRPLFRCDSISRLLGVWEEVSKLVWIKHCSIRNHC